MSTVTQLPNVSAQTRAFISGRSKGTRDGDLHAQTGGREGDGGNTGGCVGVCLQTNVEFGVKQRNKNDWFVNTRPHSHLYSHPPPPFPLSHVPFDLPLMKALVWAETFGNCVTVDICPLIFLG